ncbi:hypothetical protein BJ123_10718 [Rhodopseudomonas thermotolerans]|uniref:Uncharacterized protein n=2 Tax=Rhodopseudomonas TaxID=1073 RepID=A0A336JWH2_9BRAD|nr:MULTISPECIES: hypothetical protein [Rhodopseudomonas]RED37444.1 hypothetical protein BJ125_10718 [Rhodopseudomonas pentothenatexigens]REG03931.1 hypothetical protein BJ123_10718 [Rhodopseudomonas thermotolerans]SSW90411.1 hypothetical protein SAMN05892882_10718 [Rhodopseudomonas pentothenatexigens]
MQTHLKKRVEIFIEAPLLRRVVARFDSLRVSGYSVLPVLAGNGHEGAGRRTASWATPAR